MPEAINTQKSMLYLLKLANFLLKFAIFLLDNSSLENAVIFKLEKDKLSQLIKEATCFYKNFDEQLGENLREMKNKFGEIIEESNLLLKKLDEDAEGTY